MVRNGIPYMRAVTRLISDTPESMGAQRQQGQRTDGIIQREMSRHRDHGIEYGRAATLSVDTDRVPVCQAENFRTQEVKKRVRFEDKESKVEGDQETTGRIKEELRIWSLNVRSIGTEHKLIELQQEAERSKSGILLLQETWRRETAEQIKVGSWTLYGTGNADKPKGNGTGVMVHNSIPVESWHYISSRITAVRVRHGEQYVMIFSA